MSSPNLKQNRANVTNALVVIGFGIGWLAGLSVSPVLSIVMNGVIGIAAAVITVLTGLKEFTVKEQSDSQSENQKSPDTHNKQSESSEGDQEDSYTTVVQSEQEKILSRWQIDPLPVALLVLGIFLGTNVGIWVRNHNLFGVDETTALSQKLKNETTALSLELEKWSAIGLDRTYVARRLFEAQYGYKGWLGGNLQTEIDVWVTSGELDRKQVAQRLLESTFPLSYIPASQSSATEREPLDTDLTKFSVLRSAEGSSSVCEQANDRSGIALRGYMTSGAITNTQFLSLTSVITDDRLLKEVVKVVCSAD